ncbi:hypothetical protein J6590_094674 [Homalodisca vitripennis]|nr:hypothetical protein J6590_094674 [Homalodisca vitripennis]
MSKVGAVLILTKIKNKKKGNKVAQTRQKAAWSPAQALSLHKTQVPSTNYNTRITIAHHTSRGYNGILTVDLYYHTTSLMFSR